MLRLSLDFIGWKKPTGKNPEKLKLPATVSAMSKFKFLNLRSSFSISCTVVINEFYPSLINFSSFGLEGRDKHLTSLGKNISL